MVGSGKDSLSPSSLHSFEKPSAIQQRAIIPCIKGNRFDVFIMLRVFFSHVLVGHDVIAQAQSGTGKTATFAISILQTIEESKMSCQALILAPTRELAQQVRERERQTVTDRHRERRIIETFD